MTLNKLETMLFYFIIKACFLHLFCARLPCISAKNILPTYTYVNPN